MDANGAARRVLENTVGSYTGGLVTNTTVVIQLQQWRSVTAHTEYASSECVCIKDVLRLVLVFRKCSQIVMKSNATSCLKTP